MNLDLVRQNMQKVLEVLRTDLSTVRTGRATPALVENIVISAYGGTQKLKVMELATIQIQDPQTLVITPFDASVTDEIQKGILEANVGLSPTVEANIIRISIPVLSQERRQELVKLTHTKLENGRIMIRQIRHEAMGEIKRQYNEKIISEDQTVHREKEVQKITDEMISEIDSIGKRKEEELLQI